MNLSHWYWSHSRNIMATSTMTSTARLLLLAVFCHEDEIMATSELSRTGYVSGDRQIESRIKLVI